MIDEHVSESSATTDTLEAPRQCDWCASTGDLSLLRDEWRCATCRGHEEVVARARAFVEIHGLRPLGPSTASDDEEEEQLRIEARAARLALAQSRVARTPARSQRSSSSTTRPRAARPVARRSSRAATTVPDAARATELLDRLTAIDTELAEIGEPASLPARARRSDLENRRATILRTLAALEKARRNT